VDLDPYWPIFASGLIVQVLKEVVPQGAVTVDKSVTPPSGTSGTVFTYTIVVDPGLSTVKNVVVTDRIPPQLTNAQLLTPFGGELMHLLLLLLWFAMRSLSVTACCCWGFPALCKSL
jgi:uncharacterized repeat protein (TIGR01451 family)